jgi:hypothetical protein
VQNVRLRLDHDREAAQPGTPAQLEILLIEEKLLRESAELVKELRADRQRGAARVGDLARLGQLVRRILVAAGPGEAGHVQNIAARVEELGPPEQAQTGLRDAGGAILEPSRERSDRTRLRDRIGIQEDEHVGVCRSRAAVAAGAEAVVPSCLEDAHAVAPLGILDLPTSRAVVHNDDVDAVVA